jgi:hypothetical protein
VADAAVLAELLATGRRGAGLEQPLDAVDPAGLELVAVRGADAFDVGQSGHLGPPLGELRAIREYAQTVAGATFSATESTRSPSPASTRTVSPSRKSPSRIASASGSTSRFWITRLSGRAP